LDIIFNGLDLDTQISPLIVKGFSGLAHKEIAYLPIDKN